MNWKRCGEGVGDGDEYYYLSRGGSGAGAHKKNDTQKIISNRNPETTARSF